MTAATAPEAAHREGATRGQAEIFDSGHAPEIAWCLPGTTPAGI